MKAKDFDLKSSYGFLFNYITTDIKQRMELKLKKHNITIMQFGIMLNVYKQGPMLQKELRKFTNTDEPSIARIVARMQDKGLVHRKDDPTDKRKKLIYATPKTEELLDTLIEYAIDVNEDTTQNLTLDEQQTLRRLLQKIAL